MNLTGKIKKIFVNIITHLEMRSSWITQGDPKSNDKYPFKRLTERKGKGHVKSEAEARRMQPWAKEHQQPPGAGRVQEGRPPWKLQREQGPAVP